MGDRIIINLDSEQPQQEKASPKNEMAVGVDTTESSGDKYLDIWNKIKDDVRMQIVLSALSKGVNKNPRTNLFLRHIVDKYPDAPALDDYVAEAHGDLVFNNTYIELKKLLYGN